MKDNSRIESLKNDANEAKERLGRIAEELYRCRAIRKAKSLETIIFKLETWQNTK